MNVQSRLLGYFSGNPGDLMTPLLEVKFLEHSGPEVDTERKEKVVFCLFTEADGVGGKKTNIEGGTRWSMLFCSMIAWFMGRGGGPPCSGYGCCLFSWVCGLMMKTKRDQKESTSAYEPVLIKCFIGSTVGAYISTIKKQLNMSIMV